MSAALWDPPLPPPEVRLAGDGDWQAIGAEFLEHFIRRGHLRPDARMLEIGCGAGRLAAPLTRYLVPPGSYDGVDVLAPAIAWCADSITPRHPHFRFHAVDLHHPLYNPGGREPTRAVRLPFAQSSFDFIALVSVVTHLDREEVLAYARECARLLAPDGRCFVTAFLLNPPARESLRAGRGALTFDPDDAAPVQYADPATPLAAVAFEEDTLLELFMRNGLHRRDPASYGAWSGRASSHFQDIGVLRHGGAA